MDEDSQENKPLSSRHRSPTYSREEVKELVNLIDKYKHIVMNKSICATACQAKEAAWLKMAKLFNQRGFEYVRSAESLRRKWENIKKEARRMSKNIIDIKQNELNALDAKIVSILCEAENSSTIDGPSDLEEEPDNNDNEEVTEQGEPTINPDKYSDYSMKYQQIDCEDKQSDEDSEGPGDDNDKSQSRVNRSLNFSPKECSLLLQCVRQEKQHVFSKAVTGQALKMKNRAWSRITDSYNKLSPQKRSTKVLRTKFNNMKRMAKRVGFKDYLKNFGNKHQKLLEEKNIKKEPDYGCKLDTESDWHDNNDDDFVIQKPDNNFLNFTPDPLSSVLNGDSGIGSGSHIASVNQLEDKEVTKLKMELLNCQVETAKLERKRIEDLLQEEAAARESRALETALRLRAARLDAVAAAMRLPASHPALLYTPEETSAQQYLSQYHQT